MLKHLFFCWLLFAYVSKAAEIPTADQIIDRFVSASEDPALESKRIAFSFRRHSAVTYLDSKGQSKNRVERIYDVGPEKGQTVARLVMINGHPASNKDDVQKSSARQTGEKSRTLKFSKELMDRFNFSLEQTREFNGRSVYLVGFTAKADAPAVGFFDKLINAMHGILWIDQDEFQLVRADIHLGQKISFFGGLAGAIEKLDLSISQKRLEPGVWLPELTVIDFDGRKFFSDLKFRCLEHCVSFQKHSPGQAAPKATALN